MQNNLLLKDDTDKTLPLKGTKVLSNLGLVFVYSYQIVSLILTSLFL